MEHKEEITQYIKSLYPEMGDLVLLHCPEFLGNEKKYLNECIDTKFVSYVSHFVTDMENKIKSITGAKCAVAMVNGTEALHMMLVACGVNPGDEIITQAVTFAATSAATVHLGAYPIFVDIDKDTMGMSPVSLRNFLEQNTKKDGKKVINKNSGREIKAVLPMHTFGQPCRIDEIKQICDEFGIMLLEDAAESLGSLYKGKHTGTFGKAGILSFNGNKLATTGGGGMLITDDQSIADEAKFISTTAKKPARWGYFHTEAGWNLRMPGLNAAVGLAQLEYFDKIISNKRETAVMYQKFFKNFGISCITERADCRANYWLNGIFLKDEKEREEFLEYTNDNGVQTRPLWTLLYKMPPYEKYERVADMSNSEWLEATLVNIPSSMRTANL